MKVCIATPDLDVYSETFIRQLIEHLPFEIVTISGWNFDHGNQASIIPQNDASRIWRAGLTRLGLHDDSFYLTQRQAQWLERQQVKAVLAQYGHTAFALLPACQMAQIPIVAHFHGHDAYDDERIARYPERYLNVFEEAAAIVAVSIPMKEQLSNLGAPASRLHYVAYWVNPEDFPPTNLHDCGPQLLAVGRFVEKKAPHLTLLAFSKVLRHVPGAKLEMIGDGPLLGSCQWLARSLGINDSVTFRGKQDHSEVRDAMQRSRVFVQHSVRATSGDSEGTPVGILEAQCSGLPVVATRHGGITDVVEPGKTGFLCEEGDIDQMSKDMVRVLQMTDDQVLAMSQAARQRILNYFSKSNTIDRLAGIIQIASGVSNR